MVEIYASQAVVMVISWLSTYREVVNACTAMAAIKWALCTALG